MRVLLMTPLIRSGVFTHVSDLAQQLRQLGINSHLAVINHSKNNLSLLHQLTAINPDFYSTASELSGLVRKHHISLIHCHSPLALDSSHRVAEKQSVPLIITMHGVIDWGNLFAEALTHASAIIATGPKTARSAGSGYTGKTTVIFNGIDLKRFRPPSCAPTGKYPLRILYFGRTKGADAQGVAALDKAVGILRQQGRKLEAKLAGHAAGVFPVHLQPCGWVHDPIPYLHWSHVVFGRGRSLREAMACGNVGCLLGQGYGGIQRRESFGNGAPPSLCSSPGPGTVEPDAHAISTDLAKLDENRILLQALRKEARLTAEDNFDSVRMAEKTVKVYTQALRHSP